MTPADVANIWIHRIADAPPGGSGPLAGSTIAVKDNIDVAGVPTTAGCPSFAYVPDESATAVQRLVDAGATVVGKTNLDQFATGLVGTRSPYGAVESPIRQGHVAGGSSSGSAAAVATGAADIGVGTDTAGSGRIPAAFCGVVGLKPTRGWVSNTGSVAACASLDCTTVFAVTVARAAEALSTMAGYDSTDPMSRRRPTAPGFGEIRRIGVPSAEVLAVCDESTSAGFARALDHARILGFDLVEVDLTHYLAAGELLYGGAFVAERYASVGDHLETEPPDTDPTVAAIILSGRDITAASLARDQLRLAGLRRAAEDIWQQVDAVLTPAAPMHPTIDQVADDPFDINTRLGTFVSGANLVDWCAAVVPWHDEGADRPLGLQLLGPAWSDTLIWHAAAALVGETAEPFGDVEDSSITVAVVGAHLRGQPLNHQLTDRGATFCAETRTTDAYRLFSLDGPIAKPGLVRVDAGGAPIVVELWSMNAAGFGDFVDAIPQPHTIGTVELMGGATVSGFLCEELATRTARDITGYGGWKAWLDDQP